MSSDESVKNAVQEVLDTEGKIDILCEYIVFFGNNFIPHVSASRSFHEINLSLLLVS